MGMPKRVTSILMPSAIAYRFGPFRLTVRDRMLERDSQRIPLTPKVVDTLFVLVENAPRLVTKEELMAAVWPGVNVVESGLTRNISALRKALEEEGSGEVSQYLETIPRRGYRFLAAVTPEYEPEAPPAEAAPEPVIASPAPRRRPSWLFIAFALALVAAMGFLLLRPTRPVQPPEPEVKIGEHLLYKISPEETNRAVAHFERAIAANPKSGAAYAGLSISLLQQSQLGIRRMQQVIGQADETARRAVELDSASSPAHYAMGRVLLVKDWNFPAAETAFRRSLDRSPDSALPRIGLAQVFSASGRLRDAQTEIETALRLDPASPLLGGLYCQNFFWQRDFARTELECRKVLEREPRFALAHYYVALSLGFQGRHREAEQALADSGIQPGVIEADLAWLKLLRGDSKPAEALLELRRKQIAGGMIDASAKLLLASILGNMDEAMEALETAIRTRAPEVLSVRWDARLVRLQADPRFEATLRRAGLNQ